MKLWHAVLATGVLAACARRAHLGASSQSRTAPSLHTPEFAHERERAALASYVREHDLDWPHLLDNDYAYWNALSNRYWPAF